MTKKLNDVSVALNKREQVILQALRDLYDEKHGMLIIPLNGIAYHLMRRLLREAVEEDRNKLNNIRVAVLSLAEKGIITILDKDDEEKNFVIAKEGLEMKRE